MSNAIRITVDAGAAIPPRGRRLLRTLRNVFLALIAWTAISMASLIAARPFEAPRHEAARLGGWEADQLLFRRGSYGFRLTHSWAEADLWAQTARGDIPVHIELVHRPLFGWSVVQWHADRRRMRARDYRSH